MSVRVRMTSSLVGEDRQDWCSGEIHEASDFYARYLIGRGAAVLADPESQDASPLRSSPLTTASLEHCDPVAAHRDPESPRRGRR